VSSRVATAQNETLVNPFHTCAHMHTHTYIPGMVNPLHTHTYTYMHTHTHTNTSTKHTHKHTRAHTHTLVAEGCGVSSQFPHSSNVLLADGFGLGHCSLPNLMHHCHHEESNTGSWRTLNQLPVERGKTVSVWENYAVVVHCPPSPQV
jgi:hypothetical protein